MSATTASSRLASLALSLLAVACGGEEDAGAIVFAAAAPEAGTTYDVASSLETRLVVVASIGSEEIKSTEELHRVTSACRVTVDSAAATTATAGTIAFGECLTKEPLGFEPRPPKPDAWSGKSYAVERDAGGAWVVRGGAELSRAERTVVEWMARQLLDPAPLAPFLAGKPLRMGDSVEVPLEVASLHFDLIGAGAGVKALTLVVASELGPPHDAVVFRAAAKMKAAPLSGIPRGITMTTMLEPVGLWTVSKSTSRVVSIAMQGPATLRGSVERDGTKIDVSGDGETTFTWSVATK